MIYVSMTGVVWYGAGLVLSGDMLPGQTTTIRLFVCILIRYAHGVPILQRRQYRRICGGPIGGGLQTSRDDGCYSQGLRVYGQRTTTGGRGVFHNEKSYHHHFKQVSEEADYEPIICSGRLSFTEVRFHYPSRADIEVLKGVTFSVEPGQVIPSAVDRANLWSLVVDNGSGWPQWSWQIDMHLPYTAFL